MKKSPHMIRTKVIQAIRAFLDERGFQEIITPTFQRALPLEPNIYAFETNWQTSQNVQQLYLSTSPESSLKKMMAGGVGQCYAISKCFRNLEGSGPRHNPEFLMCEWYRPNANFQHIMNDTTALVLFVKKQIDVYLQRDVSESLVFQNQLLTLSSQWPQLSLVDLFRTHAGLEMVEIVTDDALKRAAKQKGYQTENATWSQLFDQIFLNEIENKLPKQPFFLVDFPARLSPLCQVNSQKPYLAERFEVFIAGMEIGNGNTENLNAQKVRDHFSQEKNARAQNDLQTPTIDSDFVTAIEKIQKKHQSVAGIGLGVDRLAMIMADVASLAEVDPFTL